MNRLDVNKFDAIQLGLASPEMIKDWSYGEVTKPETINYKSNKPERDGLFCEKIFGPAKDWECSCGKYKKVRNKGIVCERCGVEVTSSAVRRDRLGHIELAAPVSHIWHLKGDMAHILKIAPKQLEEVIYFVSHVVTNPGTSKHITYKEVLSEKDARQKFTAICDQLVKDIKDDETERGYAQFFAEQLKNPNEPFEIHLIGDFIQKHTGAKIETGAEAILALLQQIDLDKEIKDVNAELRKASANKEDQLKKRLTALSAFKNSGNKPEWMIVSNLPVLPPELRPMIQLDGGRHTTSDLNDLYRRVIIRNNRLRSLVEEKKAPIAIIINEKRMVQEAVDALIDNGRRTNKPVTGVGGRALKSLSHSLKGKQGRFRQNLLGKRVDYSGRSVIAVGPELKMYECGIPREMALQLFKPFVIRELVDRQIAANIRTADKMCENLDKRVWAIVEEVIDGHPVLLNRAPTLHRLGIQAFLPKLVKGKAVRLHPLVTPAFNADFDGDQMAVHVPLSKEAIAEAKALMIGSSNILGPKDGKPIVTPSQDIVLGNYYLTKETIASDVKGVGMVFINSDDAITAYENAVIDLHAVIAVKASSFGDKHDFAGRDGYLITTAGKLIFNEILPVGFPFVNDGNTDDFTKTPDRFFAPKGSNLKEIIANHKLNAPFKKKYLSAIILDVFKRESLTSVSSMLDRMKDLGFKYSTIAGITVSIADIDSSDYKYSKFEAADEKSARIKHFYDKGLLTDDERHKLIVELWSEVKDDVQADLKARFEANPNNPIFMMSDSGARGNISNFTQLAGMRGLMASPSGKIIEIPIRSSFREGLTVSEFFISTHGARKGSADTALKTAESGYLTRRLVDVAQDITIKEIDCGSDNGYFVRSLVDTKQNSIIAPLERRIEGRYSQRDIKDKKGNILVEANGLITEDIANAIVKAGITEVEIRSVFTCNTKNGVCTKCYGKNLATGGEVRVGEAIGVMAAQSIGEPGTQLTMRTFHTGGVAGGADITQGLPRIQEIIEAREPKVKAAISEIEGKVASITEDGGRYLIEIKSEHELRSYKTPYGLPVRVKKGDKVEIGQKLTDGPVSPKDLLEISDINEVQTYMLKEIQKVYALQGIEIADKHIEVMIRQMLKKVAVVDGGETQYITGARIDRWEYTEANKQAMANGKRPAYARPILLGITNAALATESFLSAASFQETTRILREAAVAGKTDALAGLKENVILGKLIPAGTGKAEFMHEVQQDAELFQPEE